MFQNLKVDVIYYKTNSDFEMEFNLCGCCRMRLLSDKTPDKKTMIMSLSRAVSRSQVIMVVGGLFGENGIIKLTAGAIGKNVSPADNETYGITSTEKIEIINGSIPLVTTEGYFGGCIIESGPQTLILLSENKNIRKSVLKNLIHPYLEELSTTEPSDKDNNTLSEEKHSLTSSQTEENDISADESDITEDETDAEVTKTEPEADSDADKLDTETDTSDDAEFLTEEPMFQFELEESENDIELSANNSDTEDEDMELILGTDDIPTTEEYSEELSDILLTDNEEPVEDTAETTEEVPEDSELLFDAETISMKEFIIRNEEYYKEKEAVEDLITGDEDDDFVFQRPSRLNTLMWIISIILLILVVVLCFCIFYVPSKEGASVSIYINEIFDTLFG